METAARATLKIAVAVARAGDTERARHLCAMVVLDAQPIIAARKELLRATLHALLVARGFKLLARMVMAVSGHSVQVILLPEDAGPIAPPRVQVEPRRMTYAMDPRWLARLLPDDMFLRDWCDALTARERTRPVPVEPEATRLQLETV
jgi:hypothetical protein